MTGKECITTEMALEHVWKYGCPRDFGLETEYMEMWCPEGCLQGDCEKCWNSKVVKEYISKNIKKEL